MAENYDDKELPNFSIEINWNSAEENDDEKEPTRFPQLSEEEMSDIIRKNHSDKTKNATNWGVLTFKSKLFFLLLILFF